MVRRRPASWRAFACSCQGGPMAALSEHEQTDWVNLASYPNLPGRPNPGRFLLG